MRNNFSLKFKLFDIFVLAFAVILIVASIITTNVVFASPKNASKTVQIYYQGELIENLEVSLNDLNEEKIIVLKKENYDGLLGDLTIKIDKEKGVCIHDVTCPNLTCQKQGWVKSVGYPVVCIPNGVYVIITSSKIDEDIILG